MTTLLDADKLYESLKGKNETIEKEARESLYGDNAPTPEEKVDNPLANSFISATKNSAASVAQQQGSFVDGINNAIANTQVGKTLGIGKPMGFDNEGNFVEQEHAIGDSNNAFLNNTIKENTENNPKETKASDIFTTKYYTEPGGFSRDAGSLAGSAAVLGAEAIPISIAGSAMLGAIGLGTGGLESSATLLGDKLTKMGLSTLGSAMKSKYGGLLLANMVKTFPEVASEAGNTRQEMLQDGSTEEEANNAAVKNFITQVPLMGLSNALETFGIAGALKGFGGKTLAGKALREIGGNAFNALHQSGEEAMQQGLDEYGRNKQTFGGIFLNPSEEAKQQAVTAFAPSLFLSGATQGTRAVNSQLKYMNTINAIMDANNMTREQATEYYKTAKDTIDKELEAQNKTYTPGNLDNNNSQNNISSNLFLNKVNDNNYTANENSDNVNTNTNNGNLQAGTVQSTVWNYLRNKGLSQEDTAAIMGNIGGGENVGWDTGAEEKEDKSGGFGLIQWTGGRRELLNQFASERGTSPSDLNTQLDFLWQELNGSHKHALAAMQNANGIADKTKAFMDTFEVPDSDPETNHIADRQQYAQGLLGNNIATQDFGDTSRPMPMTDSMEDVGLKNTQPQLVNGVNALNTWIYGQYGKDASVTGGWRSEEHNAEVNGAANSYHKAGEAVDIDLSMFTPEQRETIMQHAKEMGFTEVMFHDKGTGEHLHVALDSNNGATLNNNSTSSQTIKEDNTLNSELQKEEERANAEQDRINKEYSDQVEADNEERAITTPENRTAQAREYLNTVLEQNPDNSLFEEVQRVINAPNAQEEIPNLAMRLGWKPVTAESQQTAKTEQTQKTNQVVNTVQTQNKTTQALTAPITEQTEQKEAPIVTTSEQDVRPTLNTATNEDTTQGTSLNAQKDVSPARPNVVPLTTVINGKTYQIEQDAADNIKKLSEIKYGNGKIENMSNGMLNNIAERQVSAIQSGITAKNSQMVTSSIYNLGVINSELARRGLEQVTSPILKNSVSAKNATTETAPLSNEEIKAKLEKNKQETAQKERQDEYNNMPTKASIASDKTLKGKNLVDLYSRRATNLNRIAEHENASKNVTDKKKAKEHLKSAELLKNENSRIDKIIADKENRQKEREKKNGNNEKNENKREDKASKVQDTQPEQAEKTTAEHSGQKRNNQVDNADNYYGYLKGKSAEEVAKIKEALEQEKKAFGKKYTDKQSLENKLLGKNHRGQTYVFVREKDNPSYIGSKKDRKMAYGGDNVSKQTLTNIQADYAEYLQNLPVDKKTSITTDSTEQRTVEDVRNELSKVKGITTKNLNDRQTLITFGNGKSLIFDVKDNILISPEEEAKARKEHGMNSNSQITVEGFYENAKTINADGLIQVAQGSKERTVYHELFHALWDLALTDKEKQALLNHYTPIATKNNMSVEETMANASADWSKGKTHEYGTLWKKVTNFIKDVAHKLYTAITGNETARNVMNKIASGEVASRHTQWIANTEATSTQKLYSLSEQINSNKRQSLFDKVVDNKKEELIKTKINRLLEEALGNDWRIRGDSSQENENAIVDEAHKVITTKNHYDINNIVKGVSEVIVKQLGLKNKDAAIALENYINDQSATRSADPVAVAEMEKAFESNPDVYDKLFQAQASIQQWNSMGGLEQLASTISNRDNSRDNKNPAFFSKENFVEMAAPIEKYENMAVKARNGLEYDENTSPYKALQRWRGRGALATALLQGNEKFIQEMAKAFPSVNFNGATSLIGCFEGTDILKSQKNATLFSAYEKGLRDLEAIDYNKAVDAENSKRQDNIYKIDNQIYAIKYEKEMTDYQKKTEIAKLEKQKKAIEKKIKNSQYFTIDKSVNYDKVRQEVANAPESFKKAHEKMLRLHILLQDISVASGLISVDQAEKYRNKWKEYTPLFRVAEDEEFTGYGDSNKKYIGSTLNTINTIESTAHNIFKVIDAAETNKLKQLVTQACTVWGKQDFLPFRKVDRASDKTISVKINGQTVYYETNQELKRAVESLRPTQLGAFARAMSAGMSIMKGIQTVYNPTFAISNMLRDPQEALMYSDKGVSVKQWFSNVFKMFSKNGFNYDNELFNEWIANGGAQSGIIGATRSLIDSSNGIVDYNKEEHNTLENLSHLKGKALDMLGELGERSETVGRLAVYKQHKEAKLKELLGKGMKREQAEVIAKKYGARMSRGTMDFQKIGYLGKDWNALTLYANANLQGLANLYRFSGIQNIKEGYATNDKVRMKKGMQQMGVFAMKAAALLLFKAALWGYNNSDDERKKKYADLPRFEKDNNWVMVLGKDTVLRIPMTQEPFTYTMAGAMDRFLQQLNGAKGESKGLLKDVYELGTDQLPDLPMSNSLFKPFVEIATNYDFFRDRAIVPRSQETLPKKLQYGNNTTEISKYLGKWFDVSPRKLDHLIYSYGGKLARNAANVPKVLEGDVLPKNASEVPMVGRLFVNPYYSSQNVTNWYNAKEEQTKLYNEFKQTHKKPDGYDPALYARVKSSTKQMQQLNKTINNIQASKIPQAEKDKKIEYFNNKRIELAKRVVNNGKK